MKEENERLKTLLWEIEAFLTFNRTPDAKCVNGLRDTITKAIGTFDDNIAQPHQQWLEGLKEPQ